ISPISHGAGPATRGGEAGQGQVQVSGQAAGNVRALPRFQRIARRLGSPSMSPEDSGQATTPVPMAPHSLLPTEGPAAEESPAAETPMRQGNLRIGRAPDNDLVVDDLIVSRYHAELRSTPDGRYEITALGSPNGTYVNGRRVSARLLSDG